MLFDADIVSLCTVLQRGLPSLHVPAASIPPTTVVVSLTSTSQGMVSKSKKASPQVIVATVIVMAHSRFNTLPAFTCRVAHNTRQHTILHCKLNGFLEFYCDTFLLTCANY